MIQRLLMCLDDFIKYKLDHSHSYDVINDLTKCIICYQHNRILENIVYMSDRIDKIHLYACCKSCNKSYIPDTSITYLGYNDTIISNNWNEYW
jgi:hypothetical protein